MNDEVKLKRYVRGYSKIYDDTEHACLEVEYELKPLALNFLQNIFNINPNDPDYVTRDLAYCYEINPNQAEFLQPYVIGGDFDFDKYDYLLESFDPATCENSEEYLKYLK